MRIVAALARIGGVIALSGAALAVLGCHSAFVDAVVRNHTQKPISLLELDYPSASFGTQTLAPGSDFRYKFKVLGSGVTKLSWTGPTETQIQTSGPDLAEGDEGSLTVTVEPGFVEWNPHFKNRELAPSRSVPHALMMPK